MMCVTHAHAPPAQHTNAGGRGGQGLLRSLLSGPGPMRTFQAEGGTGKSMASAEAAPLPQVCPPPPSTLPRTYQLGNATTVSTPP